MPSNNDPAEALYLPLQGYEASVLFLIFVAITLSWECLLGILTFVNNILRGKRAHWLDRVKEEVLALGVVSLVLLFLQVSGMQPKRDALVATLAPQAHAHATSPAAIEHTAGLSFARQLWGRGGERHLRGTCPGEP